MCSIATGCIAPRDHPVQARGPYVWHFCVGKTLTVLSVGDEAKGHEHSTQMETQTLSDTTKSKLVTQI